MERRLEINGHTTTVADGQTLFEAAEGIGIHIPTSCRKQGKCRECLVEIDAGDPLLSPPAGPEEHLPEGFRLSCCTRIERPGLVRCHTMRRGTLRIERDVTGLANVADELRPLYQREGNTLLRAGTGIGDVPSTVHGLAMDLGTTTVVLRLFDLETGRAVATQSFENPQRFGGSDIMARIQFDTDHPGRLLQRVFLGYLRRAVEDFPVDSRSIVELVVAGNTTMRDLFFGLDVHSVGQLPYRSLTEHELASGARKTTSLEVPARTLGLALLHPAATVYGLPLVSGHVGADAAACLLATGLGDRDEIAMCMDIGTNTEVFVGNRRRILCASCPAGPAFEGGGVSCGVPGLDGAIERVKIGDDGQITTRVIGDGPPIGICGSGLVDLLAELRRTARMNAQGRFAHEDGTAIPIDAAGSISLTEPDVNELAQAKGANAAGLSIVADQLGVALEAIDRFYLAGGFGRHIDPAAARRIGLVPDLPDEKIVQIGNASLAGATAVLLSTEARSRLERLVGRVEHVALESHPSFFDAFVDGCQLEPIRRSLS